MKAAGCIRWAGAVLLVALAGCGRMGRFDVVVTIERDGFKKTLGVLPSVEVNLVGVNDTEYEEWYGAPASQYWEPDNARRLTTVRKGYAHVMTFGEEQPSRQILYRRNVVYDAWAAKNARHLFILCNFPRVAQDQPGNMDPRRRILPLDKERWQGYFWGKRVIWVEVTPSGLICHSTPLPPQPPAQSQ